MIIVSDTTPISELAKVELLDLLPQIFGKVVIPLAIARKLPLIGTVGILVLAKRRGLLGSVKDVLNEMQVKGTRISERLYGQVLTLAGEMEGE